MVLREVFKLEGMSNKKKYIMNHVNGENRHKIDTKCESK